MPLWTGMQFWTSPRFFYADCVSLLPCPGSTRPYLFLFRLGSNSGSSLKFLDALYVPFTHGAENPSYASLDWNAILGLCPIFWASSKTVKIFVGILKWCYKDRRGYLYEPLDVRTLKLDGVFIVVWPRLLSVAPAVCNSQRVSHILWHFLRFFLFDRCKQKLTCALYSINYSFVLLAEVFSFLFWKRKGIKRPLASSVIRRHLFLNQKCTQKLAIYRANCFTTILR